MSSDSGYLTCESFSEELLVSFLADPLETAIDVGAGSGRLTRFLSARGLEVHAFECNPKHIGAIEKGMNGAWGQWNKSSPFNNIKLHKMAASNADGSTVLRAPKGSYGWGTIDSSNHLIRKKDEGIDEFEVSMCRIDTVSQSLENVGFLKVDVEGHEPAVLEGSEHLLERCSPALYLEIYEGHAPGVSDKVQSCLHAIGYRGFFVRDERLLPIEQCDFEKHLSAPPTQCDINFIFVRNPAHHDRISDFLHFSEKHLGKVIRVQSAGFEIG